jgi:hypothetical protein
VWENLPAGWHAGALLISGNLRRAPHAGGHLKKGQKRVADARLRNAVSRGRNLEIPSTQRRTEPRPWGAEQLNLLRSLLKFQFYKKVLESRTERQHHVRVLLFRQIGNKVHQMTIGLECGQFCTSAGSIFSVRNDSPSPFRAITSDIMLESFLSER